MTDAVIAPGSAPAGASLVAYIGLGANLGDPAQAVRDAISQLSRLPGTALSLVSSLYASAPVDASVDDFINAVVRLLKIAEGNRTEKGLSP